MAEKMSRVGGDTLLRASGAVQWPGPSALRSARLPVNLIGSPINYANRLIGSPITSQSTVAVHAAEGGGGGGGVNKSQSQKYHVIVTAGAL